VLEAFIPAVQNTHEVNKKCFPDIELDLVHEIHGKHTKFAQTKYCQFARKCVLKKKISVVAIAERGQMHTAVGTVESLCKILFTAALSTA
jgi:hypothetical protein